MSKSKEVQRVETAVWAPDPERPGYLLPPQTKTVRQVLAELNRELSRHIPMAYQGRWVTPESGLSAEEWGYVEPVLHEEYWVVAHDLSPSEPFPPYRWIACYVVTGGNEGYYLHVDVINSEGERRMVYLGKFWDQLMALELSGLCTRILGA
ncbi:MAG: hypothetical protein PHO89_11705 [Methylacidiphilaceae bacterium]|nr:hypothetical protein [Candidatus Methylacidiphilaceae bacterium]